MKSFSSKRQRNRSKMRRMHGNPWDSSSSSSSRRNTSRKKSSKRVTFTPFYISNADFYKLIFL